MLDRAAKLLDEAVKQIRDIPLEPKEENMRLIGTSLAHIFDVQNTVYKLEPELMPEFLKKKESK